MIRRSKVTRQHHQSPFIVDTPTAETKNGQNVKKTKINKKIDWMAELLARAALPAQACVTSSSSTTAADSEELMLGLKAASISTVCDLLGLPPEILVEIFGYLLHTDLCRLQQVHKSYFDYW